MNSHHYMGYERTSTLRRSHHEKILPTLQMLIADRQRECEEETTYPGREQASLKIVRFGAACFVEDGT